MEAELWGHIFSFLCVKQLGYCCLVSKEWNAIISGEASKVDLSALLWKSLLLRDFHQNNTDSGVTSWREQYQISSA